MMKTNDFRRRADLALSSLTWDEQHARRVLRALDEKGERPMKKKVSIALVMMLILSLLTVGALAVAALNWSPQASAVTQARQALMDEYGLTRETISLFHDTCEKTEDGWKVTFYSGSVHESLTGEYTVTIANHHAGAAWSYDGLDKALWENGDPVAPVWGQKQLAAYLRNDEDARQINADRWTQDAYTAGAIATPAPGTETIYTAAAPDTHARELAAAALMETYLFTEEHIASGEWLDDFTYMAGGRSMRTVTIYLVRDGVEYLCSVDFDMADYAILSIDASTGGNG